MSGFPAAQEKTTRQDKTKSGHNSRYVEVDGRLATAIRWKESPARRNSWEGTLVAGSVPMKRPGELSIRGG